MKDARSDEERCTCADPIVVVKAVRKGAASSTCARCGRPIRLTFA